MLCAQRCGQLSGRASNCACRDSFFDLRFVAAKVAADYAELRRQKQDRNQRIALSADNCSARRSGLRIKPERCPTARRLALLSRAPHVGAGAGVDLDRFAFLDEKRDVNGLAGLELCRLGDVTGSIAAQTFR